MKVLLRAASVVLLAFAPVACAGVHARTYPEGPSLEVPPPPPLIVAPVESEPEPSAARPSPATSDANPATRMPRVPPPKPAPAAPPKTETPPAKPAADAGPPAASLQTTANVSELEQKIKAQLKRATADLDKIKNNLGSLSADGRMQYDEARRFAEQAEAALKVKNLPFAEQLADKSATLASLLAKR